MSAWIVGLAIGAAFLISRNGQQQGMLEQSKEEYYKAAKPATGGVTTADVRKAWSDVNFTRYGDMREELEQSQKMRLDQEVQRQQAAVAAYDAGPTPPLEIQGVLLTYDRLGI